MVHQGEVDWNHGIWYVKDFDMSAIGGQQLTHERLLQLVLGLSAATQNMAQIQAARDASERKKLWNMLKWTRRIAIGALTGAAAWATTNLLPALLKFLGI